MLPNILELHSEITKILRLKIDSQYPIGIAEQGNPSFPNWISFKLTKWQQLGHAGLGYEDLDDASEDYETSSLWRVTLNIVGVGNDSEQLVLNLAHNFNKRSYLSSFKALGLYYLNHDIVRPAPKAVSTGWEQRHILDVNFNITFTDIEELEFWNSVVVTEEINDPLDTIIYSETEEIFLET